MTASAMQNSACLMCSRHSFLHYVPINVTCLIWSIQLLLSCQKMWIPVLKMKIWAGLKSTWKKKQQNNTLILKSFLSPFKFTQLEDFLVFSSLHTRLFLWGDYRVFIQFSARGSWEMWSVLAAVSIITKREAVWCRVVWIRTRETLWRMSTKGHSYWKKKREHPFSLCTSPTLNEFNALQNAYFGGVWGVGGELISFKKQAVSWSTISHGWEYHGISLSTPLHPACYF